MQSYKENKKGAGTMPAPSTLSRIICMVAYYDLLPSGVFSGRLAM